MEVLAKGRSRAGRGPPGPREDVAGTRMTPTAHPGSSWSTRRCFLPPPGCASRHGLFLVRAEMLHIGEGRPHGRIPCFPHDSGTLPRISVFSGWAPMCRGARSAHGRISTALSVGAFPHDSADPPPAGPGRMCNTAQAAPMPHTRARPRPASSFLTAVADPLRAPEPGSTRPDTADPHPHRTRPPAPSRRSRPTPGYS